MELKLKTVLIRGHFIKIGNLALDDGLIHLDILCDFNNEITLTSNLPLVNDVISQWDNFVFVVGDKAFFDNEKIVQLHNLIKTDMLVVNVSSDEGILEFEKFLREQNLTLRR